jgi:hypothetical protein
MSTQLIQEMSKEELLQVDPKTLETQLVRHGDAWLKPIDSIPDSAKVLDTDVLLQGNEHTHTIVGSAQILQYEDQTFVDSKGAWLDHFQHGKLPIPPGMYELDIERELDLVEGTKNVVD